MLSKLGCVRKSLTKSSQEILKLRKISNFWQIHSRAHNNWPNSDNMQVIDIDMQNLDDNKDVRELSALPITSAVDIDPWVNEELQKQGTVDMEMIENYHKDVIQLEVPSNRSGSYEFEGIKIDLPKKMLSPSTYRYRHDENGDEVVPDDTRICRFDK